MDILIFISSLVAPLVILILGILYKDIFESLVGSSKNMKLKIANLGEIELSNQEMKQELSKLYEGFYDTYQTLLSPLERKIFKDIRKSSDVGQQPQVKDYFKDFDRDNPEWINSEKGEKSLGALRALRGIGLIEPVGEPRWDVESKIRITGFGMVVTEHYKDKL